MEDIVKQKVDLMVENYNKIKKNFRWDYDIARHFVAMNLASKNKSVDTNRIKEIKDYVKKEAGLFSQFKGTNLFVLTGNLYLEDDYKEYFKNMEKVYKRMKDSGLKSSQSLTLASYIMVKNVSIEELDKKIERVNEFYANMKKNHFWLTSYEDYILATVLAISDLDVEESNKKIRKSYKILSEKKFAIGNALQSLSQIMAFGEEDIEDKCNRVISLYEKLKSAKIKLGYNSLASLGVLALITADEDMIVNEIKEAYTYIREKNGSWTFSIGKANEAMIAISLVSDSYIEGYKKGLMNVTLVNSINDILMAQEQSAIVAASVASTTSC